MNSETETNSDISEGGGVYCSQTDEQGELGINRLVSQQAAKRWKCTTLVPALNMQ